MNEKENKIIKLGSYCKDIITGFEGYAIGRVIWLYGCDKYILRSKFIESHGDSCTDIFSANNLEINEEKSLKVDCEYTEGRQKELFGKLCRDKVTGFEGICMERAIYLNNTDQYALEPKASKGRTFTPKAFDEGRIEVIGDGIAPSDVQSSSGKTGGTDCYPSDRSYICKPSFPI